MAAAVAPCSRAEPPAAAVRILAYALRSGSMPPRRAGQSLCSAVRRESKVEMEVEAELELCLEIGAVARSTRRESGNRDVAVEAVWASGSGRDVGALVGD